MAEPLSSFTQHGLDWVDEFADLALSGATVLPPMHASAYFGAYFSEFDEWRALRSLKSAQSFQGCIFDSDNLTATCLQLQDLSGITSWYGKEFKGEGVALFFVNIRLILFCASSFRNFLLGTSDVTRANVTACLGYPPEPLDGDTLHDQDFFIDSFVGLATKLLDVRKLTVELLTVCPQLEWPNSASQDEILSIIEDIHGSQSDPQTYSYCESMVLHFLCGHEFGHYCYRFGSEHYFEEIKALVDRVVSDSSSSDLREEVFCDILSVELLIFISERFGVPALFPIALPIWILSLVKMTVLNEQPENHSMSYPTQISDLDQRLSAVANYWSTRAGLKDHEELDAMASTFLGACNTCFE